MSYTEYIQKYPLPYSKQELQEFLEFGRENLNPIRFHSIEQRLQNVIQEE